MMFSATISWFILACFRLTQSEIVGHFKISAAEVLPGHTNGPQDVHTKFQQDNQVCTGRIEKDSSGWILHECEKLRQEKTHGTTGQILYLPINPEKISTHVVMLPIPRMTTNEKKRDETTSDNTGEKLHTHLGVDHATIPLIFPRDETAHFIRLTSGTELEVSLECEKHHFGPRCEKFCHLSLSEDRFSCHPQTGEIACAFGWMGRLCTENVFTNRESAHQFLKSRPKRNEERGDCSTRRCTKEELRDEFMLRGSDFTDRDWIDYRGGENSYACDKRHCHINGTVLCLTISGDHHVCRCKPGYRGTRCSEADLCYFEPCFNGAVCKNTVEGAICECSSGFDGKFCEIQIDHCLDNPCGYHGECESDATGFRCTCDDGFTGEKCEVDIDDCSEDACSGSGRCQDGINTYDCSCNEGFLGKNCERVSDGCLSQPCKNGGTCKGFVDGYFECDCPENFDGSTCAEEVRNPCDGDQCNGNGKCYVVLEEEEGPDYTYEQTAFCVCDVGFTGKYCGIGASSCEVIELPCPLNATCVNLENEYVCVCPLGYEGENCELKCDPCEERNELRCKSNPCQNNARCLVSGGNTTCICRNGFSGELCETIIDFCDGVFCGHGECQATGEGYFCSCESGYTGSNCDLDIDDCLEEIGLCKNGGRCRNTYGGYQCLCLKGYEGEHCDYKIDACYSQPCLNRGTCHVDEENSFVCACRKGFIGLICEETVDICLDDPPHCRNGGKCEVISLENQEIACTCTERFYGRHCEKEIPICMVKRETADGGQELIDRTDCGSYGTCIHSGQRSFRCECREGYGGEFCDQRVKVTKCQEPYCVCERALHNYKALHNKESDVTECFHPTYGEGKCSQDVCVGPNCGQDSKLVCHYDTECSEKNQTSKRSETGSAGNTCSVLQLGFTRIQLPEETTVDRICDEIRNIDFISETKDVILKCDLRESTITNVQIAAELTTKMPRSDGYILGQQLLQYLESIVNNQNLNDKKNGTALPTLIALKNASLDWRFIHTDYISEAALPTSVDRTELPVGKKPTPKRAKAIIIIAVAAVCVVLFLVLAIGFIVWVKKRKSSQSASSTAAQTPENNNIPINSVKWSKSGKSSDGKLASVENPLIFGVDNNVFTSGEDLSLPNPQVQSRIVEESELPEVSRPRSAVSTFFPTNGELCKVSSNGAVKR